MAYWGPLLPSTRVTPLTRIRRERVLPARGEVAATIGSPLDPLDIIGRAAPPKQRRALSLSRVLGIREEDVPKRLLKQVGDLVEEREIIIAKPIRLGFQQLVYRAPGPGRIASIEGSWMVFDLDGVAVDLKALYRGTVAQVTPRIGVVIEGDGALIQGIWGSGKEGYGVLKMAVKSPDQVLEPDAMGEETRGTVFVAGAGVTEAALRRAESLQAQGLVVGGLAPSLLPLAEQSSVPVIVTEGFGRVSMSAPIFELLGESSGFEVAVNGLMRVRGGAVRPEIFIPRTRASADPVAPSSSAPLEARPGARVRATRQPYLGRFGVLPKDLLIKWTALESGACLAGVQVQFTDGRGEPDGAIIPWTNLELMD